MDDLKLFGKSEKQVESLVNTVHWNGVLPSKRPAGK